MTDNGKEIEIKEINEFNEMKSILERESELFCNYIITYNVKVLDRTITRAEDF